ncbi:5603_t:CDS:2 [Funneliformis geosporum]|nr:5603_t:CDS:2 [Funneliformis geosporum]
MIKYIRQHCVLITLSDSFTKLLTELDTVKSATINHFQNLAVLNSFHKPKEIPEY